MTKDDEEKRYSMKEIIAMLSPEDRERYATDFALYGNAVAEIVDGVAKHVPLTDERVRKLLEQGL